MTAAGARRKLAASCLLWLASCLPANPQSAGDGSLEGVVRDPSGAAIAGARVSATRLSTSSTFATVTREEGFFHLPLLPVGHYELVV